MSSIESLGIQFERPSGWSAESNEDGPRTTVSIQSPGGDAFAVIVLDEDRPTPAAVLKEALSALRDEYSDLEARPVSERIAGYSATGYDIEFFALDLPAYSAMRCFRTKSRTVLLLGQWSDDEALGAEFQTITQSLRMREKDSTPSEKGSD